MARHYCLSYLTLELSPPETVEIAAAAGFDAIGLRMMPAMDGGRAFPLMANHTMLAETERRLAETGITVFDVEIARIDGRHGIEDWQGMLECSARLGAQTVIAAGIDPDESRLTDRFAALCAAAAPLGLAVNLEFTPWTPVCDAKTALRVVTAAGQPNGQVLIDTIHAARSGTTLKDLRAIPRERLSYFQICDCPAEIPPTIEGLLFTARQERLLPGEGGVDLAGMVKILPPDLTVSVEIPSHRRVAKMGHLDWARTCLDATRSAMNNYDRDKGD
ncbi:MAG: sugar phosphate isomerase/epimerase family protein [Pseudorhodobacter sp.]